MEEKQDDVLSAIVQREMVTEIEDSNDLINNIHPNIPELQPRPENDL